MGVRESLSSEFLDAGVMSALPDLEMQARYLVSGFLSGLHRSPLRGGSSEFKEFRPYLPGDEMKDVDWKVFARTGKLHIRLREEDTDMSCYLLLDRSASMDFKGPRGSMRKWDYARAIAAAFIHFLHKQRDSVSLAFAGAGLEEFVKSASRASHMHNLMAKLHCNAAAMSSGLPAAIETLAGLVRRRSIAIVISDFYAEPSELYSAASKLRRRNCELIFIQTLDPRELDFDFDEPLLLKELESQAVMPVSPDIIRDAYKSRVAAHLAAVEDAARSLGGDYALFRSDEVPLQALGFYLRRRELMS